MADCNDFIEIEDYKNDITRIILEIETKCENLENIYKSFPILNILYPTARK